MLPPKLWPNARRHAATVGSFVDESFEVVDVVGDRERRADIGRPAVAAPVVPDHLEPIGEPPAQPEHARRAVHRTVGEHDRRGAGRPARFRPDPGHPVVHRHVHRHSTCTMRSTSVAVPTCRSDRRVLLARRDRTCDRPTARPASTSTVSPCAMRPCPSAVSTANHTISSVDSYVSTLHRVDTPDQRHRAHHRTGRATVRSSAPADGTGPSPAPCGRCACSTGSPPPTRRTRPATRRA